MSEPKLNFKEETSAKKTRSPPKKARVGAVRAQKEEAETRCGQGRRKKPAFAIWQGRTDPGRTEPFVHQTVNLNDVCWKTVKLHMGGFPSGQRGQTVNLLQFASVVRIHLRPLHI